MNKEKEKMKEALKCLLIIEENYKKLTELYPRNPRFKMSYDLVERFLRKYKRNVMNR